MTFQHEGEMADYVAKIRRVVDSGHTPDLADRFQITASEVLAVVVQGGKGFRPPSPASTPQVAPTPTSMKPYLRGGRWIDFEDAGIQSVALELAVNSDSEPEFIRLAFEFVRDKILHSSDFELNPVTCRASDVLRHRTGFCYAKSHLLAALLRAGGVPAGLCYQRLSVRDGGAPYCLHGLNAVYLREFGWRRLDARGNKPGVEAGFHLQRESLAFTVREPMERDLPEIWAEPIGAVVEALERHDTFDELQANLPDIELVG